MTEIDFYEVVHVLDTPATRGLGVNNTLGVVLGKAREGEIISYAVLIEDETYSLHDTDLRRTGQKVDRQIIYSGERINVSLDGEVLAVELQESDPD
jgi:hypothetical protein